MNAERMSQIEDGAELNQAERLQIDAAALLFLGVIVGGVVSIYLGLMGVSADAVIASCLALVGVG